MSSQETVPIITALKKEKNPKRVEQGKRLAEISKQAKERKKAERENAEKIETGVNNSPSYTYTTWLAISGLTLTAIGTYYGYKTYHKNNNITELGIGSSSTPRLQRESPNPTTAPALPTDFPALDTLD